MNRVNLNLKEKLKYLPEKAGVYLLKDKEGKVLYVGKALSLKKRVKSYFQRGVLSPRLEFLVSQVADVEWVITDSETEAFLLECNFIKYYRPRYNIRLRDDKSYPYIKFTVSDPFPQVFLIRNPEEDGSRYFGPYTNVKVAKRTLRIISRLFPLRKCRGELKKRTRPCLNYHIKECSAPCAGKITPEEYSLLVKNVSLFLEGHYRTLLSQLEEEMKKASQEERFERAAKLRDSIISIHRISQTQKVSSLGGGDKDLIALARNNEEACVLVFLFREGKLIDKKHFLLRIYEEDKEEEIMTSFVKQYYGKTSFIPPEVVLETPVEESLSIERWLSEKRGERMKLRITHQGEELKLLQLAKKNARMILEQQESRNKEKALEQLKKYLHLKEKPDYIEGFDISNIRGKQATGSVVVFRRGKPDKESYRRFRIKRVEGIDDFAMLSEVVTRRYQRIIKEEKDLPGLILIDGGKGQLSSCARALKELNLTHIPLVGLAKELEEVYFYPQSLPVPIPEDSSALKLLKEIRDEAHRFAHAHHRLIRGKEIKLSSLDRIPGVGEKTKRLLLTHFGSVSSIRGRKVEELEKIPGIGRKKAKKILEYLLRN